MPSSPRVSVAFQKARESARGAFSRPISKPIEEASFSPGIPYNFDSPPTPPSISESATLCGVYTRNADSDPTYSLSSPGSSSYQLNKSSAPSAVPIGTPLDANDAGSDPTMVQPPNTDKTDETKGKKPSDPQDVYLVAASLPKIGRPANAWILYRSDKLRAIAAGESMPPLEDFLNRSKEVAEEETTSDEGVVVSTVKGKKKKKKSKPGAQDAPADQLEKIRATMNHQQAAENRPLLPPQAEISKLISFMWKNESRAVRKKYDRMSGIKRMEHEALHPGYKYQPMKKEEKVKLKAQKQKEKVILRIEKIHKAKEAKKQEKIASKARSKGGRRGPYKAGDKTEQTSQFIEYAPLVYPEEPYNTMPLQPPYEFVPQDAGFGDNAKVFWATAPNLPDYHIQEFAINPDPQQSRVAAFPVQEIADEPNYLSFQPPQQSFAGPSYQAYPPRQPEIYVSEDGTQYYAQPPIMVPYVYEYPTEMLENAPQGGVQRGSGLPDEVMNELFSLVREDQGAPDQAAVSGDRWGEDPNEVLNRWESLDAPIDDHYVVEPSELSGPLMAQIAADWRDGSLGNPLMWQPISVQLPMEPQPQGVNRVRNYDLGVQGPALSAAQPVSPLNNDFGQPLNSANGANQNPTGPPAACSYMPMRPRQPSYAYWDYPDGGFRLPSGVIAGAPFDGMLDAPWKGGYEESAAMSETRRKSSLDPWSRIPSSTMMSTGGPQRMGPSPPNLPRSRARTVGGSILNAYV